MWRETGGVPMGFWDKLFTPGVIFWVAIAAIVIVPWVFYYWRQMKQDQHDAELKRDMIARGMSAEEIERILAAKSTKDE
jgi:hypothetical protein